MKCISDILSKSIPNRSRIILNVFYGILLALCQILRSYYIGNIVEYLNKDTIKKYIFVTIFSYGIDVLMYLEVYTQISRYNINIFNYFSDKIINLDFKELIKFNKTILSDMNESINNYNHFIDLCFSVIIHQTILILSTIVIFLYYIKSVGISIIITIICVIFIQREIIKFMDKHWNIYWDEYNKFNTTFQDVMLNVWNVKYNSLEDVVTKYVRKSFKIRTEKLLIWFKSKILSNIIPSFIFFFVIIYNLYEIVDNRQITISIRVFLIMQLFKIWKEIDTMCINATYLYQNKKHIEKICPIWQLDNEKIEKNDIGKINKVTLKDVNFGYNGINILNNINFIVEKGESISLSGKSGSGKSTIIHLLCRLYDLSDKNSKIIYNNTDIRKLNSKSLRDEITVVPQTISIFNMSIKDNIILDMKYDKERIDNIIKILELPDITINANKLSHGQKQRVLIARSLYRKHKSIFIFDEYLSAVDEYRANIIHNHVLNFIKTNNKIGIFISHNKDRIYSTDRIIKLD
jgi:ABC-type multidrug transport system fused ATPase/permease subunit